MSSIHAEAPPLIVTEPSGINYATGAALGKGGFAICHKAERYDGNKPTGHVVALKIVKSKMEPAKLAQKFVTELQIHSKLTHPNIVTFYRAFSFQTSTYVVLEICPNGSLADMLKKRKHLTLPEIRRYMIQICGAVKYLHHRHIVHRDLKTGNLFLDKDMNIKVGDFGLAALLVTEKEMEVKRRTTMCGTPNYLAPEILEKGKGHDEKVDLWAIGVIAYTLAVGKAPFHASTKEEIYKKLKSGTYAWPELSATVNQSSDLRHLVSSLLVPEEQRPIPDQIVSQNFFKIAFVPPTIPSFAREKAPQWKDLAPPSPATMKRGYSDTWYEICKESGVGEFEEGRCFKLNGGKRVRSIVHDMAQEAQLGRQPTMPIPKDVVYVSTVSSWDEPPANVPTAFGTTFSNENHCLSDRAFKEIAPNSVGNPNVQVVSAPSTDAELMPPPPPPSRPGRTGSIRKVARTISEETSKAEKSVKIPSDEPEAAVRAPKARHLTSNTNSNTVKRSADASLARRPPRAPKPKAPAAPLTTLDDMMKVSPIKSQRRAAQTEVVEILSDPEPEVEKPRSRGSDSLEPAPLSLPAPPRMGTKKLPVPRKPSAGILKPTPSDALPGTDPNLVLEKLSIFRDNLASALSNATAARSLPTDPSAAESLPFISRWVDYSRKHGIGYVLSDGTVGCIINAQAKTAIATPVTHVIARNGQKWLPKAGKEFENVEVVPLEIFEDKGERGIVRKVYKGVGSVREGPLKDEVERKRVLGVLWGKFGRYMCTSLDGVEMETAGRSEVFVRFYQRIGSVGIWAFSNGCLQIHFPDHTKLVLSSDGAYVSATCLTPEAASYLSANGDLLPHHVSSREVFSDSLTNLLNEGGRVRARVVKANALKEKLQFISEVIDQWIVNGGMGRLNEDEEVSNSRKLSWNGLVVKGTGKMLVGNVTVGRYGGDLLPK